MTVIAARAEGDQDVIVARLLSAIGWASSSGAELDGFMAGQACWETKTALRRLGVITGDWKSDTPSAEGVTFTRAAVTSWPGPLPAS